MLQPGEHAVADARLHERVGDASRGRARARSGGAPAAPRARRGARRAPPTTRKWRRIASDCGTRCRPSHSTPGRIAAASVSASSRRMMTLRTCQSAEGERRRPRGRRRWPSRRGREVAVAASSFRGGCTGAARPSTFRRRGAVGARSAGLCARRCRSAQRDERAEDEAADVREERDAAAVRGRRGEARVPLDELVEEPAAEVDPGRDLDEEDEHAACGCARSGRGRSRRRARRRSRRWRRGSARARRPPCRRAASPPSASSSRRSRRRCRRRGSGGARTRPRRSCRRWRGRACCRGCGPSSRA